MTTPPVKRGRRSSGTRLGPLPVVNIPVVNIVVLELGLAFGLVLLAISTALWWAAVMVLLVAAALGLARWRGDWLLRWIALWASFRLRAHNRRVALPAPAAPAPAAPAPAGPASVGPADPRPRLLRLIQPDLVVAHGSDHEQQPLGVAWSQGIWTAVLRVAPVPALVTAVGAARGLPLGALVPCLRDRGVVLDSIQVIWHCYPGSTALPPDSPALRAYLEVLGPLPVAARRTTWLALRLDPQRCLPAVAERGGGVLGAQRALAGALSRVRGALAAHGVPTRSLDTDQLLRAGIAAAELSPVISTGQDGVALHEEWTSVTAAGTAHASYAIAGWPPWDGTPSLAALTGVRALSATVALTLTPAQDAGQAGLRGLVRVSARSADELGPAGERLHAVAGRIGVRLTPLRGLQLAGLAATLPLGAPPL